MRRVLSSLLILAASAAAAEIPSGIARLEVLPGWQQQDGSRMTGLRITLAPGWKTYWRAPGDAGIPPSIDFGASDNVESARFHWPVPEVFDQAGMRSIGYHDQVVLPVEVRPAQAGADITFRGTLDIGVCEEICVPVRFEFAQPLSGAGRRDPAIIASLVNRPQTAQEAGVGQVACQIAPNDKGVTITASVDLPAQTGPEAVVIETADPLIWVSEPDTSRNGQRLTATVDLVHAGGSAIALDRSGIRITVLSAGRAVDIWGCPAG